MTFWQWWVVIDLAVVAVLAPLALAFALSDSGERPS